MHKKQPPKLNVVLKVSYLGGNYCGSQIQKNSITIQEHLNRALNKIFDCEEISTIFSGRTDSGVHAVDQTVSAVVSKRIAEQQLFKALNSLLPKDIRVKGVCYCDTSFNPRFDAKKRSYLYNIYSGKNMPLYLKDLAWQINVDLDLKQMQKAARLLKGTRDFSTLCAARSCYENRERKILTSKLQITQPPLWIGSKQKADGLLITYKVSANAFLYHMVRNIVGALVDIGQRKLSVADFSKALELKDRTKLTSKTAPAKGLVLFDVEYKKRELKDV